MDDYEARIRDLEQEAEGLRAEFHRLVADSPHGAKSLEGQGGATVYAA
jgi:hypothetical protein